MKTLEKTRINVLKHQRAFIDSRLTHTSLIGGYGAGKTSAGCLKCIHMLLQYKVPVLYLLPSHSLIHKAGIPRMKKFLKDFGIPFHHKITERTLITPFNVMWFVSYEEPETIEAFEVGYVLVDEIDIIDKEKAYHVCNVAVSRCRVPLISLAGMRIPNMIDFVSTPHGFKFLYDFNKVNATEDKTIIKAPSYANPYNDIEADVEGVYT